MEEYKEEYYPFEEGITMNVYIPGNYPRAEDESELIKAVRGTL